MYIPQLLSQQAIDLCNKTIGSNTFFMLVGDALVRRQPLSVVRMGDGERQLFDHCVVGDPTSQVSSHPEEWLKRMGLFGISRGELLHRMRLAASLCTYFAPSVSGIVLDSYDLYSCFPTRTRYVDNFFVNAWSEEMKISLFKEAKHVLFIHRNLGSADAMQIRAKYGLGVQVSYLKHDSWQDTDEVVAKAAKIDAPLVLFSAGPSGKYIGQQIAEGGNIGKTVLDLGNASDYWLLSSLKDAAQGRR